MGDEPLRVIAGAPDSPMIINGIKIPCYVLEGEIRVLSQRGMLGALGRSQATRGGRGGGDRIADTPESSVDDPQSPPPISTELPPFLAANNLKPFISDELRVATTPVFFKLSGSDNEPIAMGYRAELLPLICKVYLRARREGALYPSQHHIAERAEILVDGLASVAIIALVDEATGYQAVRHDRALAKILEQYIAPELREWVKTFPDEFYTQMCRLKDWGDPTGHNYPSVAGHYTNDLVYERLAPGVLEELRTLNPIMPNGSRKNRHHQWMSESIGHPKLREHLSGVIALMRTSDTWDGFSFKVRRAYPKLHEQMVLGSEDFDPDR